MTSLPSSLRTRFLVALSALLLTATLALILIGRLVIYPALLAEEREQAANELDKIERTILHDQRALLAQVTDWATWDDTYAFMQGEHAGYAASNFSQAMFEDMDYQLMLFFTPEGGIHWNAGIDPESGRYASCGHLTGACEWASPLADSIKPLLDPQPKTGVTHIFAEPTPMLAALYPILRTDESGPSMGWLIHVRLLDDRWLEALEARTGRPVDVMPIADGDTRQGLQLDRSDGDRMTISRPLSLQGERAPLRLQSQIPRDSFRTSLTTLRYGLLWTAGLLLVVIALVLVLLERMVLRPLRRFAHFTQQLQHDDESHPFPVELLMRRDEIGTLAREFQALREHQRQQQALLVEISQRDPLTGLANRRLFDERLQRAYDQARIHGKPVAAMMIDVDYFKPYNDHYGHQQGDDCLNRLAECMSQCFSDPDVIVARTGGEEFSVLLPGLTAADASHHAETLRTAVESLALPHAAAPVRDIVTISIGLADSMTGNDSPHELMRQADMALYHAKQAGRNRVSKEIMTP